MHKFIYIEELESILINVCVIWEWWKRNFVVIAFIPVENLGIWENNFTFVIKEFFYSKQVIIQRLRTGFVSGLTHRKLDQLQNKVFLSLSTCLILCLLSLAKKHDVYGKLGLSHYLLKYIQQDKNKNKNK